MCPVQYEYRVKFEDSTINTHYVNTLQRKEEDGSIIWRGFITEITGQKKLEEELRLSEESFRNVVVLSPMPSIVHHNGIIVYT